MAIRIRQRYALIDELNQDWARLVARRRDRLRWSGELAGFADPAEVLVAIRCRPDPLLGALLAEAAGGDLLAGRTVLQAMLGKVVRLAGACPDVGVDEFVAAMWCRIKTYPLARRPESIAANLALDTRKDVVRQLRTTRLEHVVDTAGQDWERRLWQRTSGGEFDAAEARAPRLINVAETLGLIDGVTSSALRAVYLDGSNSRLAATRLGTTAAMVRYRCSRGVRELNRHAELLLDAA